MPEGHTIHRLARDLNRSFRSSSLQASSPQGRFSEGAAVLDGQECDGFEAYGKHLVGHFAAGDVLHVHLGLIGKFAKAKGGPKGAVRLRLTKLAEGEVHWDLRGPMVCKLGTPDLAEDIANSVGPDPLNPKADPEQFVKNLSRRRIAIGAAILDQKVIAGIGNVYRSELLFQMGIDPHMPANKLSEDHVLELWDLTVQQLRRGERLNRIVTTDPSQMGYKNDRAVSADDRLFAYKRQDKPCRSCSTLIDQVEIGGRTMWWCPQCQSR